MKLLHFICARKVTILFLLPVLFATTLFISCRPPYLQLKGLFRGSDYIFDQKALRTYELLLPEDSLNVLNHDPMAERYLTGALVFEGDTLTNVGIRYKGSLGAFWGCVSKTKENGWPLGGKKTCSKLSMKVKIDHLKERTFYGIKKLQFHSMNNYASQMRERLSYWLFRESGIPAPRAVHAKIYMNGKHMGLFCHVEHVDSRFVERNFKGGDGALIKEVWPTLWNKQPASKLDIRKALKNNADSAAIDLFYSFGLDMSKSKRRRTLGKKLKKWVDTDYMATYAAVDRAIWNNDGAFHWWYKGNEISEPHNFYWYADPLTKLNYIIPWDMDLAFDTSEGMKIDQWGKISNRCKIYNNQRSASCDPVVKGWNYYNKKYKAAQLRLLNGPLARAPQMLDTWKKQITEAVGEAYILHKKERKVYSPRSFEKGFKRLQRLINISKRNLERATKK
ncbi:MAG: CotH kinase family protein [Fibrobacterales bacterium]